jgi:hypothetical protein
VFLINEYEYSVLRVSGGQLHTDEEGNFSTKAFGPISTPVPHSFVKTFVFETKEDELDYWDRQELYRDSIPYYNQQTSTSFPDYTGNSGKPKVDYRNNLLSAPATDFDITDDCIDTSRPDDGPYASRFDDCTVDFAYPEAVLDKADTEAIINARLDDKALADYFEAAAKGSTKPKSVANWIINDLLSALSAASLDLSECPIKAAHIGELTALIEGGNISGRQGKEVFAEMMASGKQPAVIVEEKGLKQVSDTGAIEAFCDEVITANPNSVADYKAGKEAALNFLKGQVMKLSKGKANPAVAGEILAKKLA